ncbi:MAG: hypothetical protein C5B50_14740 [Verrucomicrobia bacterium]|nr:MAG: hypothetical protein C5B50_14740 [Verrucomicrobiota bacterium]
MNNDTELLRQYVSEGSEMAFTDLVHEHVNMVYAAALREANGNGAEAQDIAQGVFTELARKAQRLLRHPSVAGWLYTTVRHLASNARRSEQRRRTRELEAHTMNELLSETSAEQGWEQLRPVLDDALHDLNETDCAAIVLRFLEDRPLREVGSMLGVDENAARMRVERAKEKLRHLLARRGITSTASGLAAALAIGAITPAPSALGATIATSALATAAMTGEAAASSITLTFIKLMSMTKVKLTLAGALVLAGIAVPALQQTRLERAKSENAKLRAQQMEPQAQADELAALREEVERLRGTAPGQSELQTLRQYKAQTEPELARLRKMAGLARRANAQADQLRAKLAQDKAQASSNATAMEDAMTYAMEQQLEGRLSRMTATLGLSPEQVQAAREILMRQAKAMSAGMQQVFSGHYDKDALTKMGKDAGDPDTQIKALLTPEQQVAYPAYKQEENSENARLAANQELLQLHSTLGLSPEQEDRVFAALYELSVSQLGGTAKLDGANTADAMVKMLEQKTKALEPILTPDQLDKYRQQQALQAKLVKNIMGKLDATGASN